jgi:hypothetical protein
MLYACVREEAPSYIIVVGFEVLTAADRKGRVCWVVISCSLERAQHVGGTQITYVFEVEKQVKQET